MDTQQIVLAAVGALIAAIVLVVLHRRVHAAWVLSAAYLFVAPLTTADEFVFLQQLKYLRLGLTVLIPIVVVLTARTIPIRGPASVAWLLFMLLYAAAAVYSPSPVLGLVFKGMFVVTVLAGMSAASVIDSPQQMIVGLRTLLLGGAAFGALVAFGMVTDPGALSKLGRLDLFGINANRFGQAAAGFVLLASAVGAYDPHKRWRLIAIAVAVCFTIVILYTGSRGAVLTAIFGAGLVLLPKFQRPLFVITGGVVIGGIAFLAYKLGSGLEATERLTDTSLDSRDEPWAVAMEYIRQSPIIGHGWVFLEGVGAAGTSTYNLHSIYFQTAAETGLAGLGLLGLVMLYLGFQTLGVFNEVRRTRGAFVGVGAVAVAGSMFGTMFFHGFAESITFTGTGNNTLMLGFGIAMLDRVRAMVAAGEAAAWGVQAGPGAPMLRVA